MILYIFGSTICYHWYWQSIGDLLENMVAIWVLWPLVDCATMYGNSLDTGRSKSIAKLKSFFQIRQDAYFTSDRYGYNFNQLLQDTGCLLWFSEESSAHSPEYWEFLGAAHVKVDASNVLFHHTGDLGRSCWIRRTDLKNHIVSLARTSTKRYSTIRFVDIIDST